MYTDQKYDNLYILSFTTELNAKTLSTTYKLEDKCISYYNIGRKKVNTYTEQTSTFWYGNV